MSSFELALQELQQLSQTLNNHGIHHALGGSGLLNALGIDIEVNDWDITTNCPLDDIESALNNYEYVVHGSNRNYASDYLIQVSLPNFKADIIGNFAIITNEGIVSVQTVITKYFKTVPLGCPKEWQKAYIAMERPQKVQILADYLNKSSKHSQS